MDFTTPEMKAARHEARLLLLNAVGAGYLLAGVAGAHLAGAKDAASTLNWILVGIGCYCLVMAVASGRTLQRMLAPIPGGPSASQIFLLGALSFLCGSILGGALAWVRAAGFGLAAYFENPIPARVAFFLVLIAAGWLISTALRPLLLNRRLLR